MPSYTNRWTEDASNANTEELSSAWFDEDEEDDDGITCINANRVTGEELQSSSNSTEEESDTGSTPSHSSKSTDEEEEITDEPLTFKEIEELAEEKGVSATELWREAAKTEDSSNGLQKTFDAEHIEKSLSRRKNSGWTEGGSLASETSGSSSSTSSTSELSSSDDGIDLTVSVDSTEEPTESELKKEAARQFSTRGGVWSEIASDLEQEIQNSPDKTKVLHGGSTHIYVKEMGNDKKATIRTSHEPFKEELEAFSSEHWLRITGGNEGTLVAEIPSENEARKFV